MPAKFDQCVSKVMSQGKDKSSAFAICTAQFKKAGLPTRENIEDVKIETQEEKYDEEGRIIVAENVKFHIEAGIENVKE